MFPENCIMPIETKEMLMLVLIGSPCIGCNFKECINNPNYLDPEFRKLMEGPHWDRIENGDTILKKLLPESKIKEIKKKGVVCYKRQQPSKRNPYFLFIFERECKEQKIECKVGEKKLIINEESEEVLISFEQIKQAIENAINLILI